MIRAALSHRVLLAGFIAAACLYMLFLEPWGHDTWFHLQRLLDVEQQLARGELRAHFAENAADGKGLPVWIYYSQWIYWPPILLALLGAPPLVALKLVYCAFLLLLCVGCYSLLRLHGPEQNAAFGTLLFVTSNYVIGEVFQRSAYAEFLSVALLPLLFLTVHRRLVYAERRAGLGLALLTALIVLFHPLSFMNAALALAAYAAYLAVGWRLPYTRLALLVPPVALGMGLSAFYWVPAVLEMRYVLGGEGVPTPLSETFLPVTRYFNFISITSLGFTLTLLAGLVGGTLLARRFASGVSGTRPVWPLAAAIFIYFLLTLRLSEPLYEAVPFLAANLWVWRVLFPMTLLVVIASTDNLSALPARLRTFSALLALGVLAVIQAAVLVLWHTAGDLSTRSLDRGYLQASLVIESQRTDGFGVAEYLPDARFIPTLDAPCPGMLSIAPEGRYDISFDVTGAEADLCIHIPRYWNVRYEASLDGAATPVYANEHGEMLLAPPGRSGRLTLRFTQPRYVTFSALLSTAAAMLLLAGAMRTRRARLPEPASPA